MPNTKSAIRRVRSEKKQTIINKIRKSKYKSALKRMYGYIDAGKIKEAKSFMPEFYSQLMKVAKSGVISRKRASRKISRFTKKIQKLKK